MGCLGIDWKDLAAKVVKKIHGNNGAEVFIKNNSAFENWIQVEIVCWLVDKIKCKIKPEFKILEAIDNKKESKEYYADIRIEEENKTSTVIELKMFYRNYNIKKINEAIERPCNYVIVVVFNCEKDGAELREKDCEKIYPCAENDELINKHNCVVYLWSKN